MRQVNRRGLWAWGCAVVVVVLPALAMAYSAQAAEASTSTTRTTPHEVTVRGTVRTESGAALPGAVVVTSAGGKAVTAPDGSFSLAVASDGTSAPPRVTAIATIAGRTCTGSAMPRSEARPGGLTVGTIVVAPSDACDPQWLPTFGDPPGVNSTVAALAVFDDGSGAGPALYVGGNFTIAGNTSTKGVARWDGVRWSEVGGGIDGPSYPSVLALLVFDDGSGGGPALYAAGKFQTAGGVAASNIAKWDGSSWSPLGSGVGGSVFALAAHSDRQGVPPVLYAAGTFTSAGGASANSIARWDGVAWSEVGGGVNGWATSLAEFAPNPLSHPALVVGGLFTMAGSTPADRIASWDGSTWSPLGTGTDDAVVAMTVYDDGRGAGPALYVGGSFTHAGGLAANRVAKWDGVAWTALGEGIGDSWVGSLAVFDDGSGEGPSLFVGGHFFVAGGQTAYHIARWDGSAWSTVGGGVGSSVRSMLALDRGLGDGPDEGPILFLGGDFQTAGTTPALRVATWRSGTWSPVGHGLNHFVWALAVGPDPEGAGQSLYAAGTFSVAGGIPVNRIARWDGQAWSPLGSGMNGTVMALAFYDDGLGDGPVLYAGGTFTTAGGLPAMNIARWDGTAWIEVGGGAPGGVGALAVFDDQRGLGPALYVAGWFLSVGGTPAKRIAKWDGRVWTPLGSGFEIGSSIAAMVGVDGTSPLGPALYVGGSFYQAGGVPCHHIAKWDGNAWSPLGSGVDAYLSALTIADLGGGPRLYAGGNLSTAGGVAAQRIAMWDGTSWSPLGPGLGSDATCFAVIDDSAGPALYVGGYFLTAGGQPAHHIAKWDGAAWSPLGAGTNDAVLALSVFDQGAGPGLVAGGLFTNSSAGDGYIARWQVCPAPPTPDLDSDGDVDATDLALLLGAWGGNGPAFDLDGDGTIGSGDLAVLLDAWTG